jgi:hypothetical protein
VAQSSSSGAERCRRKFLRFFPKGFRDETYLAWERDYKVETHQRWEEALNRVEFRRLLDKRDYGEIAERAVRTEQKSRHSMIFSFEKMALRDAVKSSAGARAFATGLWEFLHGGGNDETRFTAPSSGSSPNLINTFSSNRTSRRSPLRNTASTSRINRNRTGKRTRACSNSRKSSAAICAI